MSTRVDKLKNLLQRVEERRKAPRLHAVPAPAATVAPAAETVAPVAERVTRSPQPSPLADALAELSPPASVRPTPVPDASGELVLDDFDHPPKAPLRPTPAGEHAPVMAKGPEPLAPPKPAVAPPKPLDFAPPKPVELASPKPIELASPKAPTVVMNDPFASDPFAPSVPPAAPSAPAARASSQTPTLPDPSLSPTAPALEPVEVAGAALPLPPVVLGEPSARIAPEPSPANVKVVTAVSAPRNEAPATFGELIERTLALRPRD